MENKVKERVPKLTSGRILFRRPISEDSATRTCQWQAVKATMANPQYQINEMEDEDRGRKSEEGFVTAEGMERRLPRNNEHPLLPSSVPGSNEYYPGQISNKGQARPLFLWA